MNNHKTETVESSTHSRCLVRTMNESTGYAIASVRHRRHASLVALAGALTLGTVSVAVGCGGSDSDSSTSTAGEAGVSAQAGATAAGGASSQGGSEQAGSAGTTTSGGTSGEAGTAAQAGEAGGGTEAGNGGSDGEAGAAGEAGTPCSGDPLTEACAVTDEYAIFVAPGGTGDGTKEDPFGDLQAAIDFAADDPLGRSVLVCNGTSNVSIPYVVDHPLTIDALPQPLSVFGGFDCTNWIFDDTRRARVESEATTALRILVTSTKISIRNLELVASDATEPGDSSIAVMVDSSPDVTFENVFIEAGAGADGQDGAALETTQALRGPAGNDGAAACGEWSGTGGARVQISCSATGWSSGGAGGYGSYSVSSLPDNGEDGAPLTLSSPIPARYTGQGGSGESTTTACGAGLAGRDGTVGSPGVGGTIGIITNNGFARSDGTDGLPGAPGQGGGGGGGAKAPSSCTGLTSPTGASGGGGGAGGCGGLGGHGGQGGGASIALVSFNSKITFLRSQLVAKTGGVGGDGSAGQFGGTGGAGGSGKPGIEDESLDSCDGGNGGDGGDGGPGAGGAGGPSLSIAFTGDIPRVSNDSDLACSELPALGGTDGLDNDTGAAAGTAGETAHVLEFFP